MSLGRCRERLERDVGDPEQDSGGGAEEDTVAMPDRARRWCEMMSSRRGKQSALEGDHRRERVARVSAGRAALTVKPRNARPKAVRPTPTTRAAELEPEPAVREHGEEHEAAGDHRLDERDRGQRESRDVQHPGAERDPRSRSSTTWREETAGARERVTDVDVGRRHAPRCFHRKARLVAKRADERE